MKSDQEMEGEWGGPVPSRHSSKERAMHGGFGAAAGGQCRRRAFWF